MRLLLLLALILPQFATAGVYMCVDPQTGKKTFTDRACEDSAAREQLRVDSANSATGAHTTRAGGAKTWNSDRDKTRTGRDYREEERVRTGTADADGSFNRSGYLGDSY